MAEEAPPRMVARDGRPTATIVIGQEASDLEQAAAEALQSYLEEMSGALLPIQTDEADIEGNRILVGRTRLTEAAGVAVTPTNPGREGFRLRTAGRDVVVAGSDPLGTLYGAHTLLEALGVRWFLPGSLGEDVPRQPTIVVPPLDEKQKPDFAMRWVGGGDWAKRNKCNRLGNDFPGGFKVRPSLYHSLGRLLPVEEYFPEHPEYFALVGGKRCDKSETKLCISNPEVVREVARNMGKLLDEDPTVDFISISPTDGTNYCKCERCCALDEEGVSRDQRMSRRMLIFYNQVAEELAKTHPEARILAGAYHIYNRPPRDQTLRAHPNLALVICHYTEYCNLHPVDDPECPRNQHYRQVLLDWQKLIPDICFYEYYYTNGWRELPCPLVRVIAQDIPYFKGLGIKGLYTQYGSIWNTYLNYYVAAKLLWDAETDVDALLDDFYERFFKQAAGPMREYYTTLEQAVADSGLHLCTCSLVANNPRLIFTLDVLRRLNGSLAEAQRLAQDEKVKARLAKIAVSLEYTGRLMSYVDLVEQALQAPDKETRKTVAEQALAMLEAIHEEVKGNRGKYRGVVDLRSYHWAHAFRQVRSMAGRLLAGLGNPVLDFPKVWRFRLDERDMGMDGQWFAADHDDSGWAEIEIGRHWEDQGYDYDGVAWYRVEISVTAQQALKPLAIAFAGVDAQGWVYWNGRLLGHHDGWDKSFSIPVQREAIRTDAPNVIAVRVYDTAAKGGIYGAVALTSPGEG